MSKRRISDFGSGYWGYASYQSMAVYLAEAERDLIALTKLRDHLRAAHDERKAATERGEWPNSMFPAPESPTTSGGES